MLIWRPGIREGVAPEVAAALDRVIGPLSGKFVTLEGARSFARECALHAAYVAGTGPRATNPADSAHCCVPARAVDLELVDVVTGLAVWNYRDSRWRELVHAVGVSSDLHSLDAIGDTDHVQQYEWMKYAIWPVVA